MITYIASLILYGPLPVVNGLSQAVTGFRWTTVVEGSVGPQIRDDIDKSFVRILGLRYSVESVDAIFESNTRAAAPFRGPREVSSGLPLGRKVKVFETAGKYILCILSRRHFVTCELVAKTRPTSTGSVAMYPRSSQDRLDIEGIARRAVAIAEGQLLAQGGTISFASSSLSTRTAESGTRMARVTDWAQRRGVTVQWNTRLGTASFVKNGRQVIIPLGAEKMKVGSQWIELGETVSMVGNDWWISLAGIERAN